MLNTTRIAAPLFLIVLLLGVAADGLRAATMPTAPQMSMAGGEMSDCDGCLTDVALGDCAFVCNSVSVFAAALPEAFAATLAFPARAETWFMAFRISPGMQAPPDPFPPKTLALI